MLHATAFLLDDINIANDPELYGELQHRNSIMPLRVHVVMTCTNLVYHCMVIWLRQDPTVLYLHKLITKVWSSRGVYMCTDNNYETIKCSMWFSLCILSSNNNFIQNKGNVTMTLSYSVLYGIHEFVGKVYCCS